MKHLIQKFVAALFFLSVTQMNAVSQNINVVAFGGNYSPGEFPGYPSDGTWSGYVTKTFGTIPANTARINISLVPEIPWTGETFSYPSNWTLNTNATTSTNIVFDLTGDWTDDSDDPIFIIPVQSVAARSSTASSAGLAINARPGPNWQGTTSQTDNAQFTQVQVASVPLPVTLTSFDAKKEAQTALLSWATTEETNSDRFSIEHSLNGKNWNEIGSVKSNGESMVARKYSFTDAEPSNGENLYRLKMIDNDGSFAYSRIRSIFFDGIQEHAMVYPNPASDQVKFSTKEFNSVKNVRMYDLNGKITYSASGSGLSKSIDVKSLTPGTYIVEMTTKSGQVKTSKVVIFR